MVGYVYCGSWEDIIEHWDDVKSIRGPVSKGPASALVAKAFMSTSGYREHYNMVEKAIKWRPGPIHDGRTQSTIRVRQTLDFHFFIFFGIAYREQTPQRVIIECICPCTHYP